MTLAVQDQRAQIILREDLGNKMLRVNARLVMNMRKLLTV
jgi:hypothetical protein